MTRGEPDDDAVMERIVVGMDGSTKAAEALRWAVDEGALRRLPVTAVLVWSFRDQHHTDESVDFDAGYSESDAADALDHFVRAAVGGTAAATVWKEVVCGRAAAGLLGALAGASLLVVAPRGLGGFRGLLMGSVSQQCLRHTPCPLAVVRTAASGGQRGRVVVGVDGSDTSRRALAWAADEARARRSALEVVHTWMPPYAYGYPTPIPLDPTEAEARANEMVAASIAAVDTSGLEQPVEPIVICGGSAAGALMTRGDGAGLVVVGSRGAGGFRGLLLGSVAEQVATHATCPVVVVPRVVES